LRLREIHPACRPDYVPTVAKALSTPDSVYPLGAVVPERKECTPLMIVPAPIVHQNLDQPDVLWPCYVVNVCCLRLLSPFGTKSATRSYPMAGGNTSHRTVRVRMPELGDHTRNAADQGRRCKEADLPTNPQESSAGVAAKVFRLTNSTKICTKAGMHRPGLTCPVTIFTSPTPMHIVLALDTLARLS